MSGPDIADLVGAAVEGQVLASRLLDRLDSCCGTGDELEHAVRDIVGPIDPLAGAKLRGFLRHMRKFAERAAVTA